MKRWNILRTVAGISIIVAVAGGLALGSASLASANGEAVDCSVKPALCRVAQGPSGDPGKVDISGIRGPWPTTMAPPKEPFVDLAIILAGQNADASPSVRILNLGNQDAGQFMVLQFSAAGQREMNIPGLAAGQSVAYHDLSFPVDCGKPVQIIVDVKHTVGDNNAANNILNFTPVC